MSERTNGTVKALRLTGDAPTVLTPWPINEHGATLGICSLANCSEANAEHLAACWNACEGFEGELRPGLVAEMAGDCETLIKAITDAYEALNALDSEPTIAEALRDAVVVVETNEHIGCGGRWVKDKTSLYGLVDTCNKCGEERA